MDKRRLLELAGVKDDKNKNESFVTNIDKDTVENDNFRKVIHTTERTQLVLMSLKPGENIGKEIHDDGDQFTRVEEGEGKIILNGKEQSFGKDDAVVIAAGTEHDIINTSDEKPLKLYVVYSPPRHEDGLVEKNKPKTEKEAWHLAKNDI